MKKLTISIQDSLYQDLVKLGKEHDCSPEKLAAAMVSADMIRRMLLIGILDDNPSRMNSEKE